MNAWWIILALFPEQLAGWPNIEQWHWENYILKGSWIFLLYKCKIKICKENKQKKCLEIHVIIVNKGLWSKSKTLLRQAIIKCVSKNCTRTQNGLNGGMNNSWWQHNLFKPAERSWAHLLHLNFAFFFLLLPKSQRTLQC